jgi:hypothetical protein
MPIEIERMTVRRLQTMLDAGLIDCRELQPWAESFFPSIERPPRWLCDVASQKYSPDVSKSLGEYASSEPFESIEQSERDDEHLGSLYLRFERRELSWATFLELAGRFADSANSAWERDEFCGFLNELEDADFSPDVERKQREEIAKKLRLPIDRIRGLYESLRARRRRG